MKLLLFLCFVSCQLQASDLIFKSGFENTALVSGHVTGLNNSGLKLQLTVNNVTEMLNINSNGEFVFLTQVEIGSTWLVTVINLPNTPMQQSCSISNATGVVSATGAVSVQILCNDQLWNWNQMNWNDGGWN